MRWYAIFVATLTLGLAAAGCGGGNNESSATTDTATLSEGTTTGFFGKFDAPDEIKADVQTLAKWYQAYAAALQKAGFKAGQTPTAQQLQSYQAALAGLDQTGVAAASQRISAWAQANCHS
jgi:hypothetical protein